MQAGREHDCLLVLLQFNTVFLIKVLNNSSRPVMVVPRPTG